MPIHCQSQRWIIETAHTAYSMGINDDGRLTHSYHGVRLSHIDDYPLPTTPRPYASFTRPAHQTPEEYPVYGDMSFIEPCLTLSFADGVRAVRLRYESDQVTAGTLAITLVDESYGLYVTLHYRPHPAYDLIERWVTIDNRSADTITLQRVLSAQMHVPDGTQYHLHHLWGKWMDEWHHTTDTLTAGVKVLESRTLTTSHRHHPYVALDDGTATETQGAVWFGLLSWSGSWKITADVNEFYQTRVSLGLNDWDFAWTLRAGQRFTAPSAFIGYSDCGHGRVSHCLHDFIREQVVPHLDAPRDVLYNSWEATMFDVDIDQQKAFAEQAAQLGIELFVLDDGWFVGRKDDTAGLGDWYPDPQRFPAGLTPLIDHVHQLGMKFGLWIEPEMVNRDSDVYRQHPDWVLHAGTRPRLEGRNQLILNMALPAVQAHLIDRLDTLLTENAIDFIKWDMNRSVSAINAPDVWVTYVQGVYHVWHTLRDRHPHIMWQSCSGGGGRADVGMLGLADQVWISDNTDPLRRLPMQTSYSRVYPASTMEAWVTAMGAEHLSLVFRFHVSMCGVLGVGADLTEWDAEERETARQLIALYKTLRPVVQFGDVYRLQTTHAAYYAVQFVSKDRGQSVVFWFRTYVDDPAPPFSVRLRGLDADASYRLLGQGVIKRGDAWMAITQTMTLANVSSAIWQLERV
jgi:alpha-galactosidase